MSFTNATELHKRAEVVSLSIEDLCFKRTIEITKHIVETMRTRVEKRLVRDADEGQFETRIRIGVSTRQVGALPVLVGLTADVYREIYLKRLDAKWINTLYGTLEDDASNSERYIHRYASEEIERFVSDLEEAGFAVRVTETADDSDTNYLDVTPENVMKYVTRISW